MGWDSDLPATDQKLRTLAGTIVPNWKAIEEADETSGTPIFQRAILLADRTAVASAADPVVVGATTYVYSKQDGDSVQELYMRDAASNAVQCSQGGRLGSETTNIGFESLSPDKGTNSFDEFNMVSQWGIFSSTGGSIISKGITSSSPAAGLYTITFDAAVTSANYAVFITPLNTSGNPHSVKWTTPTTTTFKVGIQNQNTTSITGDSFCVMVVGGIVA
tara:strand:- start:3587 stop:4243 length:657 start_codon:yes stop_codon:yes gene_type:complete